MLINHTQIFATKTEKALLLIKMLALEITSIWSTKAWTKNNQKTIACDILQGVKKRIDPLACYIILGGPFSWSHPVSNQTWYLGLWSHLSTLGLPEHLASCQFYKSDAIRIRREIGCSIMTGLATAKKLKNHSFC